MSAAPSLRRHALSLAAPCLVTVALAAIGCASPTPAIDASPGLEIRVDGAYEDWRGRFTRLDARRSVGLGVTRDGTDLYFCLVTRDFGVQTLLRRAGFTLWIDPAGGRRERLGLRVAPLAGVPGAGGEGGGPPDRGESVAPRMEIVRDGAEYGYQLTETGPDHPVEARTAQNVDVVVYEFRVSTDEAPLAELALAPRQVLGVGVVSEPLPEPEDALPGAPRAKIPPLAVWAVTTGGRDPR